MGIIGVRCAGAQSEGLLKAQHDLLCGQSELSPQRSFTKAAICGVRKIKAPIRRRNANQAGPLCGQGQEPPRYLAQVLRRGRTD